MTQDFRITFRTKDNLMVMNRLATREYWMSGNRLNKEFAEYTLAIDARQKGVKIESYTADNNGVTALVTWL